MYRRKDPRQLEFPDFYLPFSGHLDPENHWIRLAQLVPWEQVEEIYHRALCEDSGQPIVPAREALGALLIKEYLGLTDRGTVEAIQENPYLQFFIGREEFSTDRPFDASSMVAFRKRFGEEGVQKISEAIALSSLQKDAAQEAENSTSDDPQPPTTEPPTTEESKSQATESSAQETESKASEEHPNNKGQLIADATCAPADIRFPTDVSLLNESRDKTEEIIDELHAPLVGKTPRPRTYREKARRKFLAFIKKKKPGRKGVRKAVKQQLGYLKRNFKAIDHLLQTHSSAQPLTLLSRRQYKNLLVSREVYRQQLEMFEKSTHRVDNRIVSVSQPHVRPIKRGKAGKPTEFGAKLSISVVGGFSFVDHRSWDNYNESGDLEEQIETYRRRLGYYPESLHVDKIYRTRSNRTYCKERGIRMSGPPLGRPPKHVSKEDKKQARDDEAIRQQVEGKFGQGKRRFSLGQIMTKLASTSATQISLTFLVMNLEMALRRIFLWLVLLARVWLGVGFGRRRHL
jgi:hypothetical protein